MLNKQILEEASVQGNADYTVLLVYLSYAEKIAEVAQELDKKIERRIDELMQLAKITL